MTVPAHYITRPQYTLAPNGVGKILFWPQDWADFMRGYISSKLFELLEIQIIVSGIFRVANLTHLQQSRWDKGIQ